MSKPHILIVEDDSITAEGIRVCLEELGYAVAGIESSGERAIKITEEKRPDLVLMDIVLKGGMDGIEAAEIIRSRWQIPIIFVTGYADEKRLQRAKQTQPFGYILKPFGEPDIKIAVEMALYVAKVDEQRRKAEEALRKSEEFNRSIIETSIDCIKILDLKGNLQFMSPGGQKLLEIEDIGSYLNTTWVDFWEGTDKQTALETLSRSQKGMTGSFEGYCPTIRGTPKWWNVIITPIIDKVGKVEHLLAVSRDITERKQVADALRKTHDELEKRVEERTAELTKANEQLEREIDERKKVEKALRVSEEKYRTLVESSEDSIYVVDKDCNFIFMNQKHLSRLKLPTGKVIDRPYGKFQSERETKALSEQIKKVFKVGNSISSEHKSERDGGYFIRTISPVKNSRGEVVSAIVLSKNITEFKQTEEALSKETNQRKMLSKRLIDLLEKDRHQTARELHDHIGQTLTSLKIGLELAYGKLTPGHTELKDQIATAKERAVQALKDIKNISLGLRPSTLETLGLVPSLRELFTNIQKQTDIEIDFFSRRIPKQIVKEKELAIYRIAQEALTNIVKHAQSQKAFVNLTRKDNKLLLSLEDDGIGFDQKDEMKASKRTGPMGLLIMRERAIQLGGEFRIESQKDKGTHVLVEIPL